MARLARCSPVFGDVELFGERLGQQLADIFAGTSWSVLLRSVQVPVRAVKLSAGAFIAAFLAAFDAFQFEIALVLGLLARRGPALFAFLFSRHRALTLYVRDHGRDLLEFRRVQPFQPLPGYPPRFHYTLRTSL